MNFSGCSDLRDINNFLEFQVGGNNWPDIDRQRYHDSVHATRDNVTSSVQITETVDIKKTDNLAVRLIDSTVVNEDNGSPSIGYSLKEKETDEFYINSEGHTILAQGMHNHYNSTLNMFDHNFDYTMSCYDEIEMSMEHDVEFACNVAIYDTQLYVFVVMDGCFHRAGVFYCNFLHTGYLSGFYLLQPKNGGVL